MTITEPKIPRFRAICGFPPSEVRTKVVEMIDTTIPAPARASGRVT